MSNTEKLFHMAMLQIYQKAKKECRYNSTYFLQMVQKEGGLNTAKILLHEKGISKGLITMKLLNRLDLTMEALILKKEWKDLFTDEERDIARKRLAALGYEVE